MAGPTHDTSGQHTRRMVVAASLRLKRLPDSVHESVLAAIVVGGATAAKLYSQFNIQEFGVSPRSFRRHVGDVRLALGVHARRGIPPTARARAAALGREAALLLLRVFGLEFASEAIAAASATLTDTRALPSMKGDSAHGANGE